MKSNRLFCLLGIIITWVVITGIIDSFHERKLKEQEYQNYLSLQTTDSAWIAPSLFTEMTPTGKMRSIVIYGKDLIAYTSKYFGPNGSLSKTTNGMNCQNCHLDAGTRPWGNNYGAVYSTFPKYGPRSNTIQNIYGRINDCFVRSLNGKAIDSASYEIQSMKTYIEWIGKKVPKGVKPYGAGSATILMINRAADIKKGKEIYINGCLSCHGKNGEGLLNNMSNEYIYPPLWGDHSYNQGAGFYRLSAFASFVFNNMPYNIATHQNPKLSIEDAWDVAAFVNSEPRPSFDLSKDWPDISKKIFDWPFGPYPDNCSQQQHKYGPYQPIIKASKSIQIKSKI